MKPVYRLVFLLSGAFALGIIAGHGVSLKDSAAQGYDGLIAEQPSATKHRPGDLPGYKGLIPGYVPDDAPSEAQNKPPGMDDDEAPREARKAPDSSLLAPEGAGPRRTAGMTPAPGYRSSTAGGVESIKMAALQKPLHLDWANGQLPPDIKETLEKLITPEQKELLGKTALFRIQGMLPDEYTTKMKIDAMLNYVNNPRLSMQERKANARKASEKLSEYANYLQTRAAMPSAIFEKMGIPKNYMDAQHEGMEKSLGRVDAALKTLKKYE